MPDLDIQDALETADRELAFKRSLHNELDLKAALSQTKVWGSRLKRATMSRAEIFKHVDFRLDRSDSRMSIEMVFNRGLCVGDTLVRFAGPVTTQKSAKKTTFFFTPDPTPELEAQLLIPIPFYDSSSTRELFNLLETIGRVENVDALFRTASDTFSEHAANHRARRHEEHEPIKNKREFQVNQIQKLALAS